MNNPNPLSIPAGKGSDVYYHYLYGRTPGYRSFPQPVLGRPFSYHQYPLAESTPLLRLEDGPQTVEDLIYQGYLAVPASDPDMAVIFDKKHTAWLGLDDVLAQIKERQSIYEKNMLELEWAKCYAFDELARGGLPPSDEKVDTYQMRLQKICAEQRLERVATWQDTWRLRETLPESVQVYLSALRKNDLLKDLESDFP